LHPKLQIEVAYVVYKFLQRKTLAAMRTYRRREKH